MHSIASPLLWTTFLIICGALLILDLAVLNRGAKVISAKAALRNTLFFVSMGGLFAAFLAWRFGSAPALEFVTGYVIEYALSVDNLFVFLVVFTYFSVPAEHQHRVLFWGILGAVVLRGVFIIAGAALLAKFAWMIFVFGAFLMGYGICRIVVEFFREPDAQIGFLVGTISMGQMLSIPMIVAGAVILAIAAQRKRPLQPDSGTAAPL